MTVPKGRTISRKLFIPVLCGLIAGFPFSALSLYIADGRQYRANILESELSKEFIKNHIVQGCSLPALMNYLKKRHVESVKDPDGGPYICGFMGVKDIRVLHDEALVKFEVSADQKVVSYSFVPDSTGKWSATQTGL